MEEINQNKSKIQAMENDKHNEIYIYTLYNTNIYILYTELEKIHINLKKVIFIISKNNLVIEFIVTNKGEQRTNKISNFRHVYGKQSLK